MKTEGSAVEDIPSQELLALCQRSNWEPKPSDIQELALKGANFFTINPATQHSVLVDLTCNNQIEAVLYFVQNAPPPLNLNLKEGEWERTYLHNFCDYKVLPEHSVLILKAILMRFLNKKAGAAADVPLDWSIKDKWGLTALDMIAYRGRLSIMWPILRTVPWFAARRENAASTKGSKENSRRNPLIQRHIIFDNDFESMNEDEQKELVY